MAKHQKSEEVRLLEQLWQQAALKYKRVPSYRNHERMQAAGRAVVAQMEEEERSRRLTRVREASS